jgi:hypothetical protein
LFMYSTEITNNGATIKVVTDSNGTYRTLRAAWLAIMIEFKDGKHANTSRRASNSNIALWIEINLTTLPADQEYNFTCS